MSAEHDARRILEILLGAGIDTFVLAPGSRSAPLAYELAALERAGTITLYVDTDERVAGFRALGLGMSGVPAPVVTTSGTAVANLHPAVLEAYHGGVPFIALTADRPARMRGTGANQTTDQVGLLGPTLLAQLDIDSSTIDEIARALPRAARGPIHLNLQFDIPLHPAPGGNPGSIEVGAWPAPGRAGTPVDLPPARTLVVAGASGPGHVRAGRLAPPGVPIIAEPSAAERSLREAVPAPLAALEVLEPEVERVIVTGHPTLERSVARLLARTDIETIVVDNDPVPTNPVGHRVVGVMPTIAANEAWTNRWMTVGSAAARAGREFLDGRTDSAGLAASFPIPGPVVLGASTIIRDVFALDASRRTFVANRGLAGIDGTISTARGLAHHAGPVTAVVGDLTFAHDIGALLHTTGQAETPIDVVVIDDHGGGIFGVLEHGKPEYSASYDRVFRTAKDLDVLALAEGAGWQGIEVTSLSDLGREGPAWRVMRVSCPTTPVESRALRHELSRVMVAAARDAGGFQG